MKNMIITELLSDKHPPLDTMPSMNQVIEMINSQKQAAYAVEKSIKNIHDAVNQIYDILISSETGRLIYCGAGTSGRIGVQDGVELNPTFGWPLNRVDFIIAGGKKALLRSVEDAEDSIEDAKACVKNLKINKNDVVIGLAASGNTKFTNEVIKSSKKHNAFTLGVTNNPLGEILNQCDLSIILDTGPEVLAGSTRLKAGTAQKICLNVISTLLMSKFGRIKNGLMSHLVANNSKLRERKKIISKSL